MKWSALLIFVAIGCRSASSRYYTLLPPPGETASPVTNELQLDILPVDVPPEVDRSEIVVRDGASEVTPVDTRAWIAPLPHEIRRAFSDDLTHALGARDIAGLSPGQGVPTYRIKLVVERFESVLGKRALIEAISTIREEGAASPALVCSVRANETAASGYDGLVQAHQRALAKIAEQVAAAVRAIRAGNAACPSP